MPIKILKENHKGQAFYLRKNPAYYLNELKNNAYRRKKKGYDDNRLEEIKELHKKRRINVGLPRRKWDKEEIAFLENNIKMEYKEIAKILNRSTGSIEHKVVRLKLRKNNSWKNKLTYHPD